VEELSKKNHNPEEKFVEKNEIRRRVYYHENEIFLSWSSEFISQKSKLFT
jgi:hypothetical protein